MKVRTAVARNERVYVSTHIWREHTSHNTQQNATDANVVAIKDALLKDIR